MSIGRPYGHKDGAQPASPCQQHHTSIYYLTSEEVGDRGRVRLDRLRKLRADDECRNAESDRGNDDSQDGQEAISAIAVHNEARVVGGVRRVGGMGDRDRERVCESEEGVAHERRERCEGAAEACCEADVEGYDLLVGWWRGCLSPLLPLIVRDLSSRLW